MKLAEILKQGPPYAEARRKLKAAVEVGKITEETDVPAALRLVFGPLDSAIPNESLDIILALDIHGPELGIPARNVRELIWLLERVDRQHEQKHKKPRTNNGPLTTD